MQREIQKILACVDTSDYAPLVLEYAVELLQGAHIVVYNVIDQRDVDMFHVVNRNIPGRMSDQEYVDKVKTDRVRMIQDLIQQHAINHRSRISHIIDVGIPTLKILEAVETEKIDLVVIANKGLGDVKGVLFGSVAEKVFRHSPVPVFSVRDRAKFKRGR